MTADSSPTPTMPWSQLRAARVAVAIVFFLHGATLAVFASFLPVIKERLHLSATEVGGSIVFSPMGAVLVLPLLGKMFVKFGTRRVLAGSATGLCLAMPFVIGAPSPWFLRAALLCTGGLAAALDAAMNAEAVEIQKQYPTPMLSSSHGCWSLGGFVGGGLVALSRRLLLDPVYHAVLSGAILLVVLWSIERTLLPHTLEEEAEGAPAMALPHGPLILIGILMMLAFGAEGAGFDWIAVYLRQSLHSSLALAALGFGIFSGAMATSRLFGDLIVLKLGNKRTMQFGAVLATVGLLAGVSAPSAPLAIAGFVLGGVAIANIVPLLFQAAGSVEGVATGKGIAAVSTMGYGMFFLAPPAVGFIADRASLSVAIGVFAVGVLGVAIGCPSILKYTTLNRS